MPEDPSVQPRKTPLVLRLVGEVLGAGLRVASIAGGIWLGFHLIKPQIHVQGLRYQDGNSSYHCSIGSTGSPERSRYQIEVRDEQVSGGELEKIVQEARKIPDLVPSESYGLMYASGGTLKCIYPNGRRHSDYRYVEHIINGRKVDIPVEELRNTGPTSIDSPGF